MYVMAIIYQNQLYIKRFFSKIMHVKARDVLRSEYTFSAGEYAYLFKIPFPTKILSIWNNSVIVCWIVFWVHQINNKIALFFGDE